VSTINWSELGTSGWIRYELRQDTWPQPIAVAYTINIQSHHKKSLVLIMHMETFSKHRRKGLAMELMKYIKTHADIITTSAVSKAGEALLKKSRFRFDKQFDQYIWRR
jgi:hypothetical protein